MYHYPKAVRSRFRREDPPAEESLEPVWPKQGLPPSHAGPSPSLPSQSRRRASPACRNRPPNKGPPPSEERRPDVTSLRRRCGPSCPREAQPAANARQNPDLAVALAALIQPAGVFVQRRFASRILSPLDRRS